MVKIKAGRRKKKQYGKIVIITIITLFMFFLTSSIAQATCEINATFNDSRNYYSYVDCGVGQYVVQNSIDISALIIALLPLILGFLLMMWANNMSEQHNILRILIYLSPIPLFWISIKYALIIINQYYNTTELTASVSSDIYIMGLIFFIIVAYFILYLIKKAIDIMRQNEQEKLEY